MRWLNGGADGSLQRTGAPDMLCGDLGGLKSDRLPGPARGAVGSAPARPGAPGRRRRSGAFEYNPAL